MSNRALGFIAFAAALVSAIAGVTATVMTLVGGDSAGDAWAIAGGAATLTLAAFVASMLIGIQRQLKYQRMIHHSVTSQTGPIVRSAAKADVIEHWVKHLKDRPVPKLEAADTTRALDVRTAEILSLLRRTHEEDLETTRSLAAAVIEQVLDARDHIEDSEQLADQVLARIRPTLDVTERTILDAHRSDAESIAATVEAAGDRVERTLAAELLTAYTQTEALLNLRGVLDADSLPPTRGWAISPDAALFLAELVRDVEPRLVVETGCGTSTVVIAQVLKDIGKGRVVALEHLPEYATAAQEAIDRLGLSDYVTIVDAPLRNVSIDGEDYQWYDSAGLELDGQIDLLFVDGPPALTGPNARFPAVNRLAEHIAPGTLILLDDTNRVQEAETAERWASQLHADVTMYPFEKGLTVLRVGREYL